jgi:putative transcriptional regulator
MPRAAMRTMRVRNEIRRLRFDRGEMTQQNLADRIGVTRQTVNAIEAAKYSPTLELAFKIAAVFEKPLGEVFHYEEQVGNSRSSGSTDAQANMKNST